LPELQHNRIPLQLSQPQTAVNETTQKRINMHAVLNKQIQISPVFGNPDERAEARYRELSALYDAQTVRHLEQRGVDQGWSCLEVGGGGGSITSWLCDR